MGAWSDMHAVSGKDRFWPRLVKEALVSPSPWSRIRMFMGACEAGGGIMVSWSHDGKSEAVGSRAGMFVKVRCGADESLVTLARLELRV